MSATVEEIPNKTETKEERKERKEGEKKEKKQRKQREKEMDREDEGVAQTIEEAAVALKKERKEKKEKKEKREKKEKKEKEEKKTSPPADTLITEDPAESSEKKEKRKIKKDKTDMMVTVGPSAVDEGSSTEIKDHTKSKKGKSKAVDSNETTSVQVSKGNDTETESKKKDKKDKKRKRGLESEAVSEGGPLAGYEASTAGASEEAVVETKKSKKNRSEEEIKARKEKKAKKNERVKAAPVPVEQPERQEETISTAPSIGIFTDTRLSDQAKKNLYYAHLHASSQSATPSTESAGWKFSKAKQNWLMRNIFNVTEVPETYVDLVLGYLKTTQGHSRAALIESAKKLTADEAVHEDTNQEREAREEVPVQSEAGIANESDVEMTSEEKTGGVQEAEPRDDEEKKVLKDRAERLLAIMEEQ
ncbi:hypothetical protein IAR55_002958 [Kwoniella newhampshirensis]|uniref:WKF domain-containing protein n=1 Tax=Kwoniella newhampshirensis TaxID=1651941 RepID=A0AAW0YP17_9TREE